MWVHHGFFIHSAVSGRLGRSHLLAPVNNDALNTDVHVSLRDPAFTSHQCNCQILCWFCSEFFEKQPHCSQWPPHFTLSPAAFTGPISARPRQHLWFLFVPVALLMGVR